MRPSVRSILAGNEIMLQNPGIGIFAWYVLRTVQCSLVVVLLVVVNCIIC